MPRHHYRVYVLDCTYRIEKRYDLEDLPDDDLAVAEACSLVGDRPYEVWDSARLVHRVTMASS